MRKLSPVRLPSIFDIAITTLTLLLMILTLYPLLYVLLASFSDARLLLKHEGFIFWFLGKPNLEGYQLVFRNKNIVRGFINTLGYVTGGTTTNLLLTTLAAFVLSRKHFLPRIATMKFMLFTMFFSGGIIPLFFVIRWLGLFNSPLAVILPGAISTYNVIIMRTFFMNLPDSLEESAVLDGANDFVVYSRIIIPLSKAVIAVIALYYGVGHWNSWFLATVFLRERSLFPLQLFLREVLINENTAVESDTISDLFEQSFAKELVKYCTIVVSTVPILLLYPSVQKYFIKGVMIGAIKG
jgi:putative aldouronate transport system permease protein